MKQTKVRKVKETKLEELERRILALESRPQYVPVYPYTPNTIPQLYPCPVCGKTYPHTCVTC